MTEPTPFEEVPPTKSYQVAWTLKGVALVHANTPQEATAWVEGWIAGRGMNPDDNAEVAFEIIAEKLL